MKVRGSPLLELAVSAATGFSSKITRFTKKFARSERKSLD